jgi:hypothetical protein
MNSKVYLDEKVRQAHYQDLLREAEKERLLAQLPGHHRSISRHAAKARHQAEKVRASSYYA